MVPMTRTDVHAPSNFVPEDYEFAYAYDAHPEDGNRAACMGVLNALIAEGWHFGQVHGGDTCDHCGARLRYVAVMKHIPSHTLIKVGEQCLDNRFDLTSAEFHSLRKAAKLNRERRARTEKLAAWLTEDDNRAAYLYATERVDGDSIWDEFYYKFVNYVDRNGEASEKFVAAILRSKTRDEEREAKRAAERETGAPVVEGKITVTGEILTVKWQDSQYGGALKMLVRDDRGFKVWGTLPSSLESELEAIVKAKREAGEAVDTSNGVIRAILPQRVTFNATVNRSDDDEQFGFFKRPTKAKVL